MLDTPQKRALKKYRKSLSKRGLARFEVLGLAMDRELIRSLAKRLASTGPEAARIRSALCQTISDPKRGRILAALRRSPLVGADLNVSRSVTDDRKVHL